MGVEYQTEIEGIPDGRWHAGRETRIGGAVASFFLAVSILVPDPKLKRDFASIALACGCIDGGFLVVDVMAGRLTEKLKEATGKQKSSG